MDDEPQGLVEVDSSDSSTILDLFGSNQFMLCPRSMSPFKVVPCPVPSCFSTLLLSVPEILAFQVALVVKNLHANTGDI